MIMARMKYKFDLTANRKSSLLLCRGALSPLHIVAPGNYLNFLGSETR